MMKIRVYHEKTFFWKLLSHKIQPSLLCLGSRIPSPKKCKYCDWSHTGGLKTNQPDNRLVWFGKFYIQCYPVKGCDFNDDSEQSYFVRNHFNSLNDKY